MAKRIVEETLANGRKRYRIQKNTILGIPTKWWFDETMSVMTPHGDFLAGVEFDTLEEAKKYLGLDTKVVSHKVIEV